MRMSKDTYRSERADVKYLTSKFINDILILRN